jgi:AcrR family transcriptional regulator
MVVERLTRSERKERTRTDLIAAARRVFLRRGFHAASLDEIAEEAGFTKGAVYSNFESKDDLFLAVLDEHFRQRAQLYVSIVLDEERLEDTYRAVARFWAETNEREPRWPPLLSEFMTHAARRESLRLAAVDLRERFLEAIAGIIDALAARHGVEFKLPTKEIARGSGAISRGMALEQLLDPSLPRELIEEMHVAYMTGLTKAPAVTSPGVDGRSDS